MWRRTSEARTDIREFRCERGERQRVRARARAQQQVDGWQMGQQFHSHDLAKTPLQLVAVDGRMAVTGNDHADPWMPERGSEMTDVEVPTPNSLPLSNDGFNFGFARQAMLPRKSAVSLS